MFIEGVTRRNAGERGLNRCLHMWVPLTFFVCPGKVDFHPYTVRIINEGV